jgi:hypothetical protein
MQAPHTNRERGNMCRSLVHVTKVPLPNPRPKLVGFARTGCCVLTGHATHNQHSHSINRVPMSFREYLKELQKVPKEEPIEPELKQNRQEHDKKLR